MPKETIKHICGHVVAHELPEGDAKRADWLRSQPCQECFRTRQAEEAAEKVKEWGLPSLVGSDENRSWADVIRVKAIAHNRDFHRKATRARDGDSEPDPVKEALVDAADMALQELEWQTDAAWWVENRFDVLNYVRKATVAAIDPLLNKDET